MPVNPEPSPPVTQQRRRLRAWPRLALALVVSLLAHLGLFSLFVLRPPVRPAADQPGGRVVGLPPPSGGPSGGDPASAFVAGAPAPVPLSAPPPPPGGPPRAPLLAEGFRYPGLMRRSAGELPALDLLPAPEPDPHAPAPRPRHRVGPSFIWQDGAARRSFLAEAPLLAALRPLLLGTERAPLRLPAALAADGRIAMLLVPAGVPGANRHRFAELCRQLVPEPGGTVSRTGPAADPSAGPAAVPASASPVALRWGILTVHQ